MQAEAALRRLPVGAARADFEGLLLQHARWTVGKAVDRHRRSQGESAAAEHTPAEPQPSLGTVTRADEARWFRTRVAALPPEQRAVVEGRAEGLTFGAIAAQLGIGEDAARKRFLTAALHLRGQPR